VNQEILDLIEETRALQSPYKLQSPALAQEIQVLEQQAATQLSYSPPSFYLELLRTTDGMDCNDFQLYASKTQKMVGFEEREGYLILGLVEANTLWRQYEPNKQYAFLAESGDVLYCHNLATNKFEIVDRVTKELTYAPSSFDTCEALLKTLLNHMLDRYDVEEEADA
jgi:hypothetical protein